MPSPKTLPHTLQPRRAHLATLEELAGKNLRQEGFLLFVVLAAAGHLVFCLKTQTGNTTILAR